MNEDEKSLNEMMGEREWRLNNLYWIEDKEGRLVRFRMNCAQRELFENMHYRNEILKARQWGISTFVELLILDCCLFNLRWHAGIIDKTRDDAELKVGKIALAYDMMDYLPEGASEEERALAELGGEIKAAVQLTKRGAGALEWENGSWVRASTSMRGGTLQFLHVSELGHVACHNPQRAKEIKTGGINAVGRGMYVVKESTHEGGRQGINYEGIRAAMANEGKKKLSELDFKFFFFTWWKNPDYELDERYWEEKPTDADGIARRRRLEDYFRRLEAQGIELSARKKAWYESMEATMNFAIRQEYPSTVNESFEQMAERAIYGTELAVAREQGRVDAEFEADGLKATYVSWDLGQNDLTTMWLIQVGGDGKYYVLDHHAAHRKAIDYYVAIVRDWEAKYKLRVTKHILPHDSKAAQWMGGSFADLLRRADFNVSTLPVTKNVWVGIAGVRRLISHCVFHINCSVTCRQGLEEFPSGMDALGKYQTAPAGANGVEKPQPLHDIYSHSADSFRYFAEAIDAGLIGKQGSVGSFFGRGERQGGMQRAMGAEWLDDVMR